MKVEISYLKVMETPTLRHAQLSLRSWVVLGAFQGTQAPESSNHRGGSWGLGLRWKL